MAEPMMANEKTLRDYGRVLRRRWPVIALAVAATVGAALLVAFLTTPIYQATAQMLVQARSTENLFDPNTGVRVDPKRAVATEIQVLKSEPVQQRVKERLGIEGKVPKVSAATVGDTDVVEVRARHQDAPTSALIADAYVKSYIEFKREQAVGDFVAAGEQLSDKVTELQGQIAQLDAQIDAAPDDQKTVLESQRQVLVNQQALFKQRLDQLQVDSALQTGGAQLVTPAEVPEEPAEPQPLRTAALALVVGALLGIGAAFLLDYLDDSLKTRDDLERVSMPLPVLAVIPHLDPPDERPISIGKPDAPSVEAYRTLRTSVQFLGIERPLKVLQVTSSISGEGKTTTAANLAVVLAQAGNRVVLVDADLRRPRIQELFRVKSDVGLTNVLLGQPAAAGVQPVSSVPNLFVLPAGPVPPNPSEMLGGRAAGELFKRLAETYDIVIVDSPPVLPVTDSIVLTGLVDGVMLVARAGRTSSKQVQQSVDLLGQVTAPVLGTVFNEAGSSSSLGYGYAYQYGYGPRKDETPRAGRKARKEEAAAETV